MKYFYEQTPEYYIIAAGSLLGVSVGKQSSFPVGKVNFMTLYPMTFMEYLIAFKEDALALFLAKRLKAWTFAFPFKVLISSGTLLITGYKKMIKSLF